MGACVRYVVFPIRSKILKPGLWVVEKKSKYPSFFQVLKWMWFWVIETHYQFEISTVGKSTVY